MGTHDSAEGRAQNRPDPLTSVVVFYLCLNSSEMFSTKKYYFNKTGFYFSF